jgi:hypothetical protein
MSTMLDIEAWLLRASVLDRHEAQTLHDAVAGMRAVDGFECMSHQGAAPWLVRSPHTEDTLALATPAHREVLLGMLRHRHGLDKAPCSRLAHWRLPPHVRAAQPERPAPAFRPHA